MKKSIITLLVSAIIIACSLVYCSTQQTYPGLTITIAATAIWYAFSLIYLVKQLTR